ncbi:MAG: hypothetical protein H6745_12530 [Deltaproteobacteria bacterium]|nr:hypothetical protein [Deltaproteobacteria bacterium]
MTLADDVRAGSRRAVREALNLVESERAADLAAAAELVDALAGSPREGARIVGLTGPPGVGKSTLAGALVRAWRGDGLTVGVVAVDPSSRRSGGAFLGDRARIDRPPGDDGVFVRSMAARDRLGGLAPGAFAGALVLRAAYDRVLVETVGVGQSETDVATVADATAVVVQPASGDVLQFIKAGLMELDGVLVVNKADLGAIARRSLRDLRVALGLLGRPEVPLVLASAHTGDGVDALARALDAARPGRPGPRAPAPRAARRARGRPRDRAPRHARHRRPRRARRRPRARHRAPRRRRP